MAKILFFRDIAHWNFPARAFLRDDARCTASFPAGIPTRGLVSRCSAIRSTASSIRPTGSFFSSGRAGWQACSTGSVSPTWRGARPACAGWRGAWAARPRRSSSPGFAWALSGYTTAQWTSGLLLFADAWIPWAAVGHVALLDSLRAGGTAWRRGLVKAALPSVFAVLLGEIFLAMIGAGFGVLFALVLQAVERHGDPSLPNARPALARHRCGRRRACIRRRRGRDFPARMLLGSSRAGRTACARGRRSCSLHPLRLVEFALPQSMGDAYGVYPAATVVGEPRLDGLPLSFSMYMGASVLALVLAAFGRGRRLALVLGGLAAIALLLAFGKYTPAHAIFRRVVFPLSYMRYPEKYMVLVVAVVALLASLGARSILSDERQPWRRTGVLLLLIVAFAFVSALTFSPAWVVFAVHGALLGGLATLGMLAVHVLAGRASPLAPLLLVAVVTFDLSAAAWPLLGFGPRRIAGDPPPAARLALQLRSHPEAPPRLYPLESHGSRQ